MVIKAIWISRKISVKNSLNSGNKQDELAILSDQRDLSENTSFQNKMVIYIHIGQRN